MSPPSGKPAAPGEAELLTMVDTPTSPSSGLALSRFEFETGKGNEGTKILMVEWDGSAGQPLPSGGDSDKADRQKTNNSSSDYLDWDIWWESKPAVLHVRDTNTSSTDSGSESNEGCYHRVYFLLPPGAVVPALVTITQKDRDRDAGMSSLSVLRTKPMPAIFPAQLGGADKAGRRGVLHTIWARKRLAELEAEIAAEMKENGESVGLEMAMQERLWIVDHFGLAPEHEQGTAPPATALHATQIPISPTSPRSPIGGKLGEKLRGLKLATSPSDLAAASQAAKSAPAVGGTILRPTAQAFSRDAGNGGLASLDAIVGDKFDTTLDSRGDENTEEELFALPMSPRSPDMKRSPFSLL